MQVLFLASGQPSTPAIQQYFSFSRTQAKVPIYGGLEGGTLSFYTRTRLGGSGVVADVAWMEYGEECGSHWEQDRGEGKARGMTTRVIVDNNDQGGRR